MERKINAPSLRRDGEALPIELRAADGLTRLKLSASSEAPVERWFGTEILSHEPGAMNADRLKRGAVPLLFNHNWDDPIGMVDAAQMRDRRLLADAHLFDTARAREVAQMIDGGLRNVSIGYQLNELEDQGDNVYVARSWDLLEVSVVTVPADPSIGIGRNADADSKPVVITTKSAAVAARSTNGESMSESTNAAAGAIADVQVRDNAATQPVPGKSADKLESERKTAIVNLCRANKLDERFERHWIETGASLNTVADEMVNIMAERSKLEPQSPAMLGMEAKEVRRYSLVRALRATLSNNWKDAGLELEAHKAIMARTGRQPKGSTSFYVPLDIQRRDMTVAGVSGSNYLVSTDNLSGSFIELLRNESVSMAMGVTRLSGLVGNVTIPKQTAASTAYWLSDETTQITESQPTIGQVTLTPKNVAALTEISHLLISQSDPSVENLVLRDLARVVALAVDVAVLRGSGNSGQPQGIVGTSGVGSVSGSSLGYAGILEFQSDVAANNALLPGSGYVTTPAIAADMMQTARFSNTDTPVWEGNILRGAMAGFPAMSSNQMASATMLFGSWPSVLLGEWGVLELMTNPYSDFTRGLSAIRAWYTCDVAMRHPGAFSYASSIT